jgi:hypothetical protein
MSKRYVFFRTPEGRPYKGSDGKHSPTAILARFGEACTMNEKGEMIWPGFLMTRLRTPLRPACVVLDPDGYELDDVDAWEIVWKGLISEVRKKPGKAISPQGFLREADAAAAGFFRQPLDDYALITSLSVANLPPDEIQVRGCTISGLDSRGTEFPLPPGPVSRLPAAYREHLSSTRYRLIKVGCKGRSLHQAVNNAFNAIHLLRGLWSLLLTYGSRKITFGGKPKMLGIIYLGPVQTLHSLGGPPVDDDLLWYDPDYVHDHDVFEHEKRWQRIEKNRHTLMKWLNATHYRQEIEDLLIRYAVALDQRIHDVAFLQMWSILEALTGTVGGNYDETIRRAIWHFSPADRLLAKDSLSSLRFCRNRYVHSGQGQQESDQIAYEMKSYIDPHLLKLIKNVFKVDSLEEYGRILAMPSDVNVLKQQRAQYTRVLRVLTKAAVGN